jgi:hypothetical protein
MQAKTQYLLLEGAPFEQNWLSLARVAVHLRPKLMAVLALECSSDLCAAALRKIN